MELSVVGGREWVSVRDLGFCAPEDGGLPALKGGGVTGSQMAH